MLWSGHSADRSRANESTTAKRRKSRETGSFRNCRIQTRVVGAGFGRGTRNLWQHVYHATALALGYFSTCAAMGVVGLTIFGEAARAGGAASMVGRVISATVGGLLIGLYAAVPRRASIMQRSLRIWRENDRRAITVALCFVLGAYFLIRGPSGL